MGFCIQKNLANILLSICLLSLFTFSYAQVEEWKIPCNGDYKPGNCNYENLTVVESVIDFERCGPALMPKIVRDYFWHAAGRLENMWENKEAYNRIRMRYKSFRDVSKNTLETTILGQKVKFPIGVAPTSQNAVVYPEGEIAVAKAAGNLGTIMIVSQLSSKPLESVAAEAPPGSILWMQHYHVPNMTENLALLRRAENAGYKAIVLTIDNNFGHRGKCDSRSRFYNEMNHISFPNFIDFASNDEYYSFLPEGITWTRKETYLPIVVKGVMTVEDAIMAVNAGASAIYVSNHGGRVMDSAMPTIEVLPEIVKAVNSMPYPVEVYVDGGIRRGGDALKAFARGAKAVFIGRPSVWGLAMGGQEGVERVFSILQNELSDAMIQTGFTSPDEISISSVVPQLPNFECLERNIFLF